MNNFNIRVYGLLINDKNQILISDERRNDFSFTKFPGGGLEFGEGIKDALIREFQEELSLDIKVGELFYFNEHFQQSAFYPKNQLITFYYLVHFDKNFSIGNESYDVPLTEEGERQRWVNIDTELSSELTFPLDKIVLNSLLLRF